MKAILVESVDGLLYYRGPAGLADGVDNEVCSVVTRVLS